MKDNKVLERAEMSDEELDKVAGGIYNNKENEDDIKSSEKNYNKLDPKKPSPFDGSYM